MLEKIKTHSSALFFILTLVLTGSLGFGLGRWSKVESLQAPLTITSTTNLSQNLASASLSTPSPQVRSSGGQQYVGSKNGTKYHLPSCSGAQRIKEENRVYFGSKEEAEKAGYTPAANCPGL